MLWSYSFNLIALLVSYCLCTVVERKIWFDDLPQDILILIAEQGPIRTAIDLLSVHRTIRKTLFPYLFEKYLYDCPQGPNLTAPRRSLEKIYKLWLSHAGPNRLRLEQALCTHQEFRRHRDCLINGKEFSYTEAPSFAGSLSAFSLKNEPQEPAFHRWLRNAGPQIDRPILALVLQHGRGLEDISIDGNLLKIAVKGHLRVPAFRHLLVQAMNSPKHLLRTLPKDGIINIQDQEQSLLLFLVDRALILSGVSCPEQLATALYHANNAGLTVTKLLDEFSIEHNLPITSEERLLLSPEVSWGSVTDLRVQLPSSSSIFYSYPGLDRDSLFALVIKYPNSWSPTAEFIQLFCSVFTDDQLFKINGLLVTNFSVALHADTIDLLIERKVPRSLFENFIVKFPETTITNEQLASAWKKGQVRLDILCSMFRMTRGSMKITLDFLKEMPQDVPEDIFLAFVAFSISPPETLFQIMMKRKVSAVELKKYLLIQGPGILKGHSCKEWVEYALANGYNEELVDYFKFLFGRVPITEQAK